MKIIILLLLPLMVTTPLLVAAPAKAQYIAPVLNHFVSQSQAQLDQDYIDCLVDKECKANIGQKFNASNLPDCDATGQVGLCWDHRENRIHE